MSSKDYLSEDSIKPEGQNFVCISFLSDKDKKTTLTGIKVRGIFDSIDRASEHAKKLQSVDPAHNVFVGEVGKWLAFDPDVNSKAAGDPEYANEQLNSLMKGYLENQEKAKLFHEQNKLQKIRESLQQSIDTSNENIKELEERIAKSTNDDEIIDLNKKLNNINEQIKELKLKQDEYIKSEQKIAKSINKEANISV